MTRACTCHPDDKPPIPCAKKYALKDCRLADAKSRYREMEGHAARWAKEGAPLWVMADAVTALGSIAGEISKLEGKTQ